MKIYAQEKKRYTFKAGKRQLTGSSEAESDKL